MYFSIVDNERYGCGSKVIHGEGLKRAIELIGGYLMNIEQLLSQPRYLLLMIMATFVVII